MMAEVATLVALPRNARRVQEVATRSGMGRFVMSSMLFHPPATLGQLSGNSRRSKLSDTQIGTPRAKKKS